MAHKQKICARMKEKKKYQLQDWSSQHWLVYILLNPVELWEAHPSNVSSVCQQSSRNASGKEDKKTRLWNRKVCGAFIAFHKNGTRDSSRNIIGMDHDLSGNIQAQSLHLSGAEDSHVGVSYFWQGSPVGSRRAHHQRCDKHFVRKFTTILSR